MKPAKFDFTLSGFIIAMILVAMLGTVFSLFMSEMSDEFSIEGNNSFEKYENYTDRLKDTTQDIRDSTDISQQEGILDVIGGYFSAGYSALKTGVISFDLFTTMMNDASTDIEEFGLFKTFIIMILLVGLFVGVIITILVKWKT